MNISHNEHPFFLNVHHENYSHRRQNRSLASELLPLRKRVRHDGMEKNFNHKISHTV